MKCYHIHIEGRVQGVGFRPFIFNLANKNALSGTVANTLEGVHIFVRCVKDELDHFIQLINDTSPPQALITSIDYEEIPSRIYEGFSIIESDVDGNPDLLITPDFAICDQCKRELKDPNSRRYHYPYITCTFCGPRYSIEQDLPYDRQRTSMGAFHMCDTCKNEYSDPNDGRFYSQTNSCPHCRISQWVVDCDGNQVQLAEEEIINFICEKIKGGSVVAVKGIGGFLLLCDPKNEDTVKKLRNSKQRPSKPFALMYPNIDQVGCDVEITKKELNELNTPAAPILLFGAKKRSSQASKLVSIIAPGLNRLGIMLPYAPLLLLMAEKINQPMLATSGNQKASPIIYKNEEAVESLHAFADYFLMNNRDIHIPQDDSVVKYSDKYQKRIMIRRSRGFAPAFVHEAFNNALPEQVLAMGALLKSTFCIWQEGRVHVSQFLGDTTEFDAQISYEHTLNHMKKLLKFKPDVVLVDKHPAYFATLLGKEMHMTDNILVEEIQHHEAHLWAALGENKLLHHDQPVLGVVFDGTGMGNDGAIWGGEFYSYFMGKLSKITHMSYYPHILGDKMAREPRLSAFAMLQSAGRQIEYVSDYFTPDELEYFMKVLDHATLKTSSIGRWFDAVSSLLGLCQINTYEGEAAMYLETEAQAFCDRLGHYPEPYKFTYKYDAPSIDYKEILDAILSEINLGKKTGEIAARFHRTIVQMIEKVAQDTGHKSIAFSGGVFQNGLLVDMAVEHLSDAYQLYFHKELSPNDECISYGQLVGYYATKKIQQDSKENIHTKNTI